MSRRNISKKRFPKPDASYNSYLVSLLIVRILKAGKKSLAKKIVYTSFKILEKEYKQNPLKTFERAVQNTSPMVELKSRRARGSSRPIPIEITSFRSTILSLRWLIYYSKQRSGKSMSKKLASEIFDASKKVGGTVKKKEAIHRMAESNKAFSHFRYKLKR